MVKKTNIITLLVGIAVGAVFFVLGTGKSSAATINVVAGSVANAQDGQCRLYEAIQNINDQAQTSPDCPAGDGNNDTINLPAGTITLLNGLPTFNRSVKIQGQGRSQTILEGDNGGQFNGLSLLGTPANDNDEITVKDLTIRSIHGVAFVVSSTLKSILFENIEIDGNGASFDNGGMGGIQATAQNVNINNVYIHGFSGSGSGNNIFGVNLLTLGGNNITANISNITVSNLIGSDTSSVGGVTVATGVADSLAPANINMTVNNATVDNIQNNGVGTNVYIGGIAAVNGGSSVVNMNVYNTTLRSEGLGSDGFKGVIGAAAYSVGQGDTATINITTKNTISAGSSGKSCEIVQDGAEFFGAPSPSGGTNNIDINSLGGNIVSDNSCSGSFTQATDKNNIANLKDSLNDLANNGGSNPTILPKAGSLAIDGGVCGQNVLNTDARGISRPQGVTCDSGAVEVQQAALVSANGLTSANGTSKIYLDIPVPGAIVSSASLNAIAKDKDSGYEYPFGMLGFTMQGVPSGSTQTINLYFESDKQAEAFVARKFTASNNTYFDLPDATITQATKNNKPAIKLSYQIKDGGPLDADGQANGSVTDPVGLAVETAMLANTGVPAYLGSFVGAILVLGGTLIYIDYRKHKAPLLEADKESHSNFAKSYTFWHHIKVVTIPTAHYKLTIRLDKKIKVDA